MRALMILAMLALAGCGADGEPERPQEPGGFGLSISGTATIGIRG